MGFGGSRHPFSTETADKPSLARGHALLFVDVLNVGALRALTDDRNSFRVLLMNSLALFAAALYIKIKTKHIILQHFTASVGELQTKVGALAWRCDNRTL